MRDVLSTGNVPHPLGIGPHPTSLIPIRQRHETLGNIENAIWLDNFLDGGLSIDEFNDLFTTAESTVVSPIILDLDGDGVETIGVTAGAYFDHDGNGFAESTGWVGADDGLLVWDRNGDGRINDGKELFGSETLLSNGTKATNGYQALAELDSNTDGKIDANDAGFASLKVWKDLDGDGYSATGELFSLADVGVQSINTGATASSYVDPNGNAHRLTGSFTKTDGTTGATADVWFQTNKLYTIQEEYLNVPMAIAALPDLRGYGNVYDLQQAMVRDGSGSLKALVEQFVAESNPGTRNQIFEQILFKWSGSDTIDPASRGSYIDARRLAFLEKVFAQSYVGSNGSPNPAYNTAPLLNDSFLGVRELMYAQLLAQTHLKSLYDRIAYSWDTTTQSIRGDLSAAVSSIQTQLATDSDAGKFALAEFARSVKGLQAEATLDYTTFRNIFAAQDPFLGAIVDSASDATIYGTAGNDVYNVGNDNDLIFAGLGNDVITLTGAGTNTVDGGEGNDTVTGGWAANNTLYGGAGDDILQITRDNAAGAASRSNTLAGGLGNDYLEGSAGADTYLFNRGDGSDAIGDNPYEYAAASADRVVFGAGIAAADLRVRRDGSHLVLDIADPANPLAADRLTLRSWYADSTPYCRIESLVFADGSTLGIAALNALAATGTEGADTLTGWHDEAQTFRGFGGNDTITGSDGADTLEGGAGDDVLNGGWGGDTYLFNRNDAADMVRDAGGADTLRFGTGINSLDLVFSRSGNNLVMSTHGTTDSVTVENWYTSSTYQVETTKAGNNSTLANTQVEQLIQAMATFSAQNGGISWDQAIDQRPDDVQAILAANWMPAS